MSNDNRNLWTHIQTDPNASDHIALGAIAAVLGMLYPNDFAPLAAGIILGIAIEVWQRLHGGRNTLRESIMDAATTALPGAALTILLEVIHHA